MQRSDLIALIMAVLVLKDGLHTDGPDDLALMAVIQFGSRRRLDFHAAVPPRKALDWPAFGLWVITPTRWLQGREARMSRAEKNRSRPPR